MRIILFHVSEVEYNDIFILRIILKYEKLIAII